MSELEALHDGGNPALKGRVGQAEHGLCRAGIEITGVEWTQNMADNFASVQTILFFKVHWLLAFFSHSRYNYAQGSAVQPQCNST